jgi:N-methylhydantoinase B
MALDAIDYAVITQALLAAAREMGAKLVRSAYSTIVREARDASAAILDRHGHVIAQAEMIPMQLGSMRSTLRPCLDIYGVDDLTEDDFFVNNHPYHGGQHLQDVFIFTPIFVAGTLIGFSGSVAHHLELGGGGVGLNNSASDLYQEGLIIPPSKYSRARDWYGGTFERHMAANIRVPDQTIGDMNAQFAANAIGVERVRQLAAKYGTEAVTSAMAGLIDYTERQLRAAIRTVPDGVYLGEDAMDDDGVHDEPLWIRAKLTVAGDTIAVDFEGTAAQVTRNLNAPFASTNSAVMSCIKGVLLPADVPFNEGSFRPVTLTAPLGSILNPRAPAPVRARMEPCYRAYGAVMKALAQAVPDRVIAAGFDATLMACLSEFRDGRFRVCLEADSFGHGKFRGGAGLFRAYEVLEDNIEFSIYTDRFRVRPDGAFGGTQASLSRCDIFRNNEQLAVDPKQLARLMKGDIIRISTSGGAGYGLPADRARALVQRDIEQGFISADTAADVYGQSFA